MLQGVLVDLVPFDASFEEHNVAWVNGPMGEWWGMDGLISQAGHTRWRQQQRERPEHERRSEVIFGIRVKDGTPIGIFDLMHINAVSRHAEVGAGIGNPDYWGGGYGSDAMLLIVEYAFAWLDFHRLWLLTSGRNFRAQKQITKCGWTLEGRRRELEYMHGGYHDFVYYGLLADEWPGYNVMVERLGLREKALERGLLVKE